MRILALARDVPGTHPEAFAPHLDAEAPPRLGGCNASGGLLREIHFRASRRDAVLLLDVRRTKRKPGMPLPHSPLVRKG
jgi:hypothetical protein